MKITHFEKIREFKNERHAKIIPKFSESALRARDQMSARIRDEEFEESIFASLDRKEEYDVSKSQTYHAGFYVNSLTLIGFEIEPGLYIAHCDL